MAFATHQSVISAISKSFQEGNGSAYVGLFLKKDGDLPSSWGAASSETPETETTSADSAEQHSSSSEASTEELTEEQQHQQQNEQQHQQQASYPEVITDPREIHSMGTLAQVRRIAPSPMGGAELMLVGHRRIRMTGVASAGPPLMLEVEHLTKGDDYEPDNKLVEAYRSEVLSALRDVASLNPLVREAAIFFNQHLDAQVCKHGSLHSW